MSYTDHPTHEFDEAPPLGDAPPAGAPAGAGLDDAPALDTRIMDLNMGPSHPAMHGTIRMVLKLDGEKVVGSDVQIGYLHRGFEKEAENVGWTQVFPYTDRLNYVSPLLNNIGYAMGVEKMLGVTIPERAQWIRVVMGELSRLTDHLTCVGASAMELGGFSAFLYFLRAREELYKLIETCTGARLTVAYVRVGGLAADLPPGFAENCERALAETERLMADVDRLLTRNRIFYDRTRGIGTVSRDKAVAMGWTGPCGRASGIDYDVRRDAPYYVYPQLDWDVVVGAAGDNYERYLVRMEEMVQSMRIVRQALKGMPAGPIIVNDPKVALPPKEEVYNTIEAMVNHFELIMAGIQVPAGEVYSYTEAANGELGFYIVSEGAGRPWKCRVRPPCIPLMSTVSEMVNGYMLPDIVPTFGSVNMVGGECDR
jgi:NADH-quinone oxidoreductase subunit D